MKFFYSNLFDFYLEKIMMNGTNQQDSLITTPNDIYLEEQITDINPSENEIPSMSDIQNNGEDIRLSIDENLQ